MYNPLSQFIDTGPHSPEKTLWIVYGITPPVQRLLVKAVAALPCLEPSVSGPHWSEGHGPLYLHWKGTPVQFLTSTVQVMSEPSG